VDLHHAVALPDVDLADLTAVHAGLSGDGTDEISGTEPVALADADEELGPRGC
jgi:hypothetical protein